VIVLFFATRTVMANYVLHKIVIVLFISYITLH